MLTSQAPDKWGGWHWAHCPHPECSWLCRAACESEARSSLEHHQAEAHR